MKWLFVLCTLLTVATTSFAQKCDCLSQFKFVVNYFESNNPAFQKIKNNPHGLEKYKVEVKNLIKGIQKQNSVDFCSIYLKKYVALLKDHHSGIDLNLQRLPIDFNSERVVDSFKRTPAYRSFKKLKIDTSALITELASKSPDDVQGLYTSSTMIMGITKMQGNNYAGLVMKQTRLVDVGHVLLELKKIGPTTFECVYHTGLLGFNFQNIYETIEIKNGSIPELGFSKIGTKSSLSKPYAFRSLGDSTNYLRLTSFRGDLKPELDSFYNSLDSTLQSKPYLIIDLTDNGGGAEACYMNLLKYIYTRPFEPDKVDVWVSPDNIKRYEETGTHDEKLLSRMKGSKPFHFISQQEVAVKSWSTEATVYPRKIAVLFNRKTASAAEGMISYCLQSDKVITMGENSGGYIGYGDVTWEKVPCGNFVIRNTTTRYHSYAKYEFIGIKPMIFLKGKKDWVAAAREILEKNYEHCNINTFK